ncbi:hypothetical protein AAE478_001768 [Parahypoxylon ruwenzoriense]
MDETYVSLVVYGASTETETDPERAFVRESGLAVAHKPGYRTQDRGQNRALLFDADESRVTKPHSRPNSSRDFSLARVAIPHTSRTPEPPKSDGLQGWPRTLFTPDVPVIAQLLVSLDLAQRTTSAGPPSSGQYG